jgi:hypothetical protein
MADDLKRAVVWKSLLIDGTDYCGLWHTAEGWLLKGTVIGVLKDQRPMLASYEIHCDENWLTHRVQVERTIGSDVKTLNVSVENRGVWRSSGQDLHEIQGRDDVDLAVTPATNTLAIRRLNLQVGAARRSFPLGSSSLSLRFNRCRNATLGLGKTPIATKATPDSRLRSWSMILGW